MHNNKLCDNIFTVFVYIKFVVVLFRYHIFFQFIEIYQKYKASRFARRDSMANAEYKPNRITMAAHITICLLLPALIILVFIPSLVFTYFEGWDYSISVYYSFVTLSTIGKLQNNWTILIKRETIKWILCFLKGSVTSFLHFSPKWWDKWEITHILFFNI